MAKVYTFHVRLPIAYKDKLDKLRAYYNNTYSAILGMLIDAEIMWLEDTDRDLRITDYILRENAERNRNENARVEN
jgi:hypothetical protein